MKIKYILSMAVVALMSAACTNDVNDVLAPEAPQQEGYHFFATIAPKTFDATTRALTEATDENGKTYLKANWEKDEKIALFYGDVTKPAEAKVEEVASDGSAIIKVTLDKNNLPTDGQSVQLNYPFDIWNSESFIYEQDGTLSCSRDLRQGLSKFKVDGTDITLEGGVELEAVNSICKFSIKDITGDKALKVDQLVIKYAFVEGGIFDITIEPKSANSDLYVTLLADMMDANKDVWFEATVGNTPYIAKGRRNNMEDGKFYQTTLKMATLGDLMGADGKFYANGEAATTAGTSAIGVIAHLGSDYTEDVTVGGGHGLVMALKNAYANEYWSNKLNERAYDGNDYVTKLDDLTRTTGWSGYNATISMAAVMDGENPVHISAYYARNYSATAPEGTTGWFLPSAQQWVKMITGLGGLEESNLTWNSWFDPTYSASKKWEEALKKAGEGNYDSIRDVELWYWTSSETSADSAVTVVVNNDSSYGLNVYGCPKYDYNRTRVRAMLAF